MVLHRPFRHSNRIRDLAVAVASNHESQHCGFTLRERIWRIQARKVWFCSFQASQDSFRDSGFDESTTRFQCTDGLGELLQSYVFEQKAARTGSNTFQEQVVIVESR